MGTVVARRLLLRSQSRQRRTLLERLYVGVPGLYRLLARFGSHLRPDSRLRRWLIAREVASGLTAAMRRDYELVLVRYASDVEWVADSGWASLGIPDSAGGHDELVRAVEQVWDSWRAANLAGRAFIDLGDRLLTFSVLTAEGSTSSAEVASEYAQLLDQVDGVIVREQDFYRWDACLDAAGLRRDEVRGLEQLLATGEP